MGEFALMRLRRLTDRLSEMTGDLAVINGQIVSLETALKVLRKERSVVEQEINRLQDQLDIREV